MYNEKAFVITLINVLKEKGITTDKIHLQKFTSFLSDNDNEIPFRFSIYIYGPFSRELESVLDTMRLWDDLKFDEKNEYDVDEYFKSKQLNINKEKISGLVDKFINIFNESEINDFSALELFSTVYYYKNRFADKNEVYRRFQIAKENKFSKKAFDDAYKRLNRI